MLPIDLRRSLKTSTFVASLLVLSACGSDSPLGPGLGEGSLSMNVDGSQWSSISVHATASGGVVALGAANSSGEGVGFAFQGSAPGTFLIAAGNPANATYTTGSNSWAASGSLGGSGTITISTLNSERVAGTFSFEVTAVGAQTPATISLTNGVFDIEF